MSKKKIRQKKEPKKTNKKESFVKICPFCGSTDYVETLAGQIGITGLLDRCKSCGQVSTFPLIHTNLINKFRQKLKGDGGDN